MAISIKKTFLAILILLFISILLLLINTFRFKSSQIIVEAIKPIDINESAVQRFEEAISIRTISFADEIDFDSTQFYAFNQFLEKEYPLVHQKLEHKIFNSFSHLYKWEGQNASLDPVILMAHIDAVPIAAPSVWTVHPFTEGVKDDTIYGRGSMDNKFGLIGILEATEQLLEEGFTPNQTIYLSFGHDEELSGKRGAVQIASYMDSLGIKPAFILDEGLSIVRDLIPGMDQLVALIGIAEKGSVSLEVNAIASGGHSSTPSKETSIDILSKAIVALKSNPLPANITPVLHQFMDKLGPEMDFMSRLAFANRRLFGPMIMKEYGKSNAGNAIIRTTTAPTVFNAGLKENVIPTSSSAIVNFRIIPGETFEDIKQHAMDVIDDDRVEVLFKNKGENPTPISNSTNASFKLIETSIKQIYPNVLTAPSLVLGATDSRHFTKICSNIYRFNPYIVSPENLNCFHGVDERIPITVFKNGIRFYRQIIRGGIE